MSLSTAGTSRLSAACSMHVVQQQKVLSPIHRHVRGKMRLPHDKAHCADRAVYRREKWQLNINCSTITSYVSIMNDNCQAVMVIMAARCNDLDVQQFQQPLRSVGISNLISYRWYLVINLQQQSKPPVPRCTRIITLSLLCLTRPI